MTSRNIYVQLGRNGDLLNLMPLWWAQDRAGNRPIVCVSKECGTIFNGISYIDEIQYNGSPDDVSGALRWLKVNRPKDRRIISQVHRNPVDKGRLTPSYQMESWRLAKSLDQFGMYPLVIDRRDSAREAILWESVDDGRPVILVATNSISSPFSRGRELLDAIRHESPGYNVVDLNQVRADYVYDLLGLYDRAACLVSVDTVHLHLCRASKVPVVAITNNGWLGSVPPPTCVETIRYEDVDGHNPFFDVICAVDAAVNSKAVHRYVVHACQMHGHAPRHERAQATWDAAYAEESIISCCERPGEIGEHSGAIGDHRDLPFLRDLLDKSCASTSDDDDVVILSNSDVSFTIGSFAKMKEHAGLFGAFTMRRREMGQDSVHIGREVFGFRKSWLRDFLPDIPNFYLGAPAFDLVLAAFIRKLRGIKTTNENLHIDFFPCDLEPGMALHEPHESSWAGGIENTAPANLHNLRLAREWCAKNMPTLKL